MTASLETYPAQDPISSPVVYSSEVSHLPLVNQNPFKQYPKAEYMVGLLSLRGSVLMPEAFRAARILRYNKYHELGWIDESQRAPDGGELLDEYDNDGAHIGVMKNTPQGVRMIAHSRLILKSNPDTLLPVEKLFAQEYFQDNPAPINSLEISRLISDSRDKTERYLASTACQRAMSAISVSQGWGPAYAMVEGYLIKQLKKGRIPFDQPAGENFKEVPEYDNTLNTVIRTDGKTVFKTLKLWKPGIPLTTALFYKNATKNLGIGYFGKNLVSYYGEQQKYS